MWSRARRPIAAAEDDLLLAVLDAGAEEVTDLGESFEVVSEPTDLVAVRTAVMDAGIEYDSADPTFIASVNVPLDVDGARKVIKLIDAIEDLDDVQNVYTNADIPDEVAGAAGRGVSAPGRTPVAVAGPIARAARLVATAGRVRTRSGQFASGRDRSGRGVAARRWTRPSRVGVRSMFVSR